MQYNCFVSDWMCGHIDNIKDHAKLEYIKIKVGKNLLQGSDRESQNSFKCIKKVKTKNEKYLPSPVGEHITK